MSQDIWEPYGFHCWAPKAPAAALSSGAVPGGPPPPPPWPLVDGCKTEAASLEVLQVGFGPVYVVCLRLQNLLRVA